MLQCSRWGSAVEDRISDILGDVERGRLASDQAVRLLLSRPVVARTRGIRWLRIEFGSRRPVRLRVPFVPAAMLLAGVEVAIYPAIIAAGWLMALWSDDVQVKRILSGLPLLPLSRILLAVLRFGAPFGVAVQDGGDRFRISVD